MVKSATTRVVWYVEYSVSSGGRAGRPHQHTNWPLAISGLVLTVDQYVGRVGDPDHRPHLNPHSIIQRLGQIDY